MTMIRIQEGEAPRPYREPTEPPRDTNVVGLTILYQIPPMLRLRLGWRETRFSKDGLIARITAGRTVWIEIILNKATDLYRVSSFQTRKGIRKDRFVWDEVCVEQMIQILDLADRGEIHV